MGRILKKVQLILNRNDAFSYNSSSVMQGVLMQSASYDFSEKMHLEGSKPYSQHIYRDRDSLIWTVNTFSDEANSEFAVPLLEDSFNTIHISSKDTTLEVLEKKCEDVFYDDLLKDTFFSTCSRYMTIRFKTPTAFKVNGKYQFYPTTEHIFKSLINKFNECDFEANVDFDESTKNISDYIEIRNYSLKSTFFHLEGIKIPAFIGQITIKINGPQQLVSLVHLLVRFGEFSGVGIKTAIGMGAIEIVKKTKEGVESI